jgi:hypothetical protein
MDIVQALKVPEAMVIKRLELARNGRHLLVVSNARAITSYQVGRCRLNSVFASTG